MDKSIINNYCLSIVVVIIYIVIVMITIDDMNVVVIKIVSGIIDYRTTLSFCSFFCSGQ